MVTDSGGDTTSYNNLGGAQDADRELKKGETKNTNLYNDNNNTDYNLNNGMLYNNGRCKNDKNWQNWERIREQKLERMKNICFESYRQSKRERMLPTKPKPKQLDPSWYTDNIYSNRSEDLEDEYVPECIKYGTYRKLRNIREHEEEVFFSSDDGKYGKVRSGRADGAEARVEYESDTLPNAYGLQRSTSCKEFQHPIKSQSCCFRDGDGRPSQGSTTATTSILKNRNNVPKSYSFSASSRTAPFDVMDYELPPRTNSRQENQEAHRKSLSGYCCSGNLEDALHTHPCCARERCTNSRCLLDEIYCCSRSHARHSGSLYGAVASVGSNRNLLANWEDRGSCRAAAAASTSGYSLHHQHHEQPLLQPPPAMICCCSADDYCYHRQQQLHMRNVLPPHSPRSRSRLRCPGHHPAAEEEEHYLCRAEVYDTDLEHFIRDERERLLMQDKFLEEDERYLAASTAPAAATASFAPTYPRSFRNKLVHPPARYDDDSCSDSTEMDLEDFNIDLEKYWEELEKPPSPLELDIQQRNMRSNLKVKNVNVGCYNNGQPIALHDRERERLLIKKSLLEGMPSPPQASTDANVTNQYHFFEHVESPIHRSTANAFRRHQHQSSPVASTQSQFHHHYPHKVYPAESLPSYKYNNFYPDEDEVHTQQPVSGGFAANSALSLINNIFSIYKPNKYSPNNCQLSAEPKPEPCKKMNVPSTRHPLGVTHSDYIHSLKRPLIVSTEQPHFKIIPEKTGLKISPLYRFDEYGEKPQTRHKLTSTARPLMLPH